ncbi:class I SAM-dependent methyltransferase [Leptospira levettii]|uniref:Class I SAM-dependent methyltransferase n=1 Tax=Leptospira levettii TaxID=2023178 RepID=A0ABY2MPV1_9LEPT|nr:class I SAM-dependent methyltransferase [Leptospira levettii]TGL71718.1 class I SAM-dependent methyltransferase [Leptospira levettii]TGM84766.1 class I SAM-dependent methyltransferase [Leptospira levettii]
MEQSVFEHMAKQYDTNDRIQLAKQILGKLEPFLHNTIESSLLDFGCGTGLLGIPLCSHYKQVILCDDSPSMLEVSNFKIISQGIKNAHTMFPSDLVLDKTLFVDNILMSLVLLHIPDSQSILKILYDHLNPNGKLYIVDFCKNEKVSHPKIHSGFLLGELESILKTIGYQTVNSKVILEEKKVFMNEDASLFLLIAEK